MAGSAVADPPNAGDDDTSAVHVDVRPEWPRICFRRPPLLQHDTIDDLPARPAPTVVDGFKVIGAPAYRLVNGSLRRKLMPNGGRASWAFKPVRLPGLMRHVLRDHGYEEWGEAEGSEESGWTVIMCTGFIEHASVDLTRLQPYQKANRIPGVHALAGKAQLWECFAAARERHGAAVFDFMPEHFLLPKMSADYERHMRARLDEAAEDDEGDTWILKPDGGCASFGTGIFLHRPTPDSGWGGAVMPKEVRSHRGVASLYIDRPYLMDGVKSDLRLYVLVTSVHPLVVYLYDEGLARFATTPYDRDASLDERTMHLTNYTLNKHSATFDGSLEEDQGSKRSLSAFRRRITEHLGDERAAQVWRDVDTLIVKTAIAAHPALSAATRRTGAPLGAESKFYQLLGFDVMLDEAAKPWLLEVNADPSLGTDSPVDLRVKLPMLVDMLNVVGLGLPCTGADSDTGGAAGMDTADELSDQGRRRLCQLEHEHQRSEAGRWRRLFPSVTPDRPSHVHLLHPDHQTWEADVELHA
jgi:hypothetical protein